MPFYQNREQVSVKGEIREASKLESGRRIVQLPMELRRKGKLESGEKITGSREQPRAEKDVACGSTDTDQAYHVEESRTLLANVRGSLIIPPPNKKWGI